MSRYETVFILTPVLSEEQTKEAVKKFESYLKDNGAKMVHKDAWGLKKLAYPIQKKTNGFYQLFEFEMDGEKIQKFEVELKRDERIMRFLTVRMDKHHVLLQKAEETSLKKKLLRKLNCQII